MYMSDQLGMDMVAVVVGPLWPLTPKFDRATRLFLKFDMRHGAYRHATGLSKI